MLKSQKCGKKGGSTSARHEQRCVQFCGGWLWTNGGSSAEPISLSRLDCFRGGHCTRHLQTDTV
eukprot:720133-Amphidinium_carterae.1